MRASKDNEKLEQKEEKVAEALCCPECRSDRLWASGGDAGRPETSLARNTL